MGISGGQFIAEMCLGLLASSEASLSQEAQWRLSTHNLRVCCSCLIPNAFGLSFMTGWGYGCPRVGLHRASKAGVLSRKAFETLSFYGVRMCLGS